MKFCITLGIVFFILSAEAQTREDGNKILAANNFYQTPEKYKNYYAKEFEIGVKQAIAEGREADAKKLREIQMLKAHGIGQCQVIFNIPQGILTGTTIQDDELEEGRGFKEKHVNYLYTDWKEGFVGGTLKQVTEHDECALFDYSKSLDRILVGKILGLGRGGEHYIFAFYTFVFETKQFVFQFNENRRLYRPVFSSELKNIEYQVDVKNKKTSDNPLGVGSHPETLIAPLKKN